MSIAKPLSNCNKTQYDDDFYDNCKIYLSQGNVPQSQSEYEKRTFKEKCSNFTLENNRLYCLIRSKTLNVRKHKVELIAPRDRDRILKEMYEDTNTSRNGRDSFYYKIIMKYINISRRYVMDWLQKQTNYQLHVSQPKEKIYRPDDTTFANQRMMIDLIDLQNLSGYNSRREYILTAIDTFTKFAFCRTITKKTGDKVLEALKDILKENYEIMKSYPLTIHSDNGTEFVNNNYKNYLDSINVKAKFGRTYTPTDQATIERFNKTIKYMIFSYLSLHNTNRYYDVLDSIVKNYNNSIHSTIKATPISIHKPNRDNIKQFNSVMEKLETFENNNKLLPILNVGDLVRLSIQTLPQVRKNKLFAKGFVSQWSVEIYKIARRMNLNDPSKKTKYKIIMIKDVNGNDTNELIKTYFSRDDLQLIK